MIYKFKGKPITLISQKRRLPNGFVKRVEIIRHPGAALIVPFLDSRRVIFNRQYRPSIKVYLFELPAGTLDPGESLSACAHRELLEETGYWAQQLTRLGKIFPVPGYSTEVITIFKAQKIQFQGRHLEPDEIIQTHIFTKKQVRNLFRKGKIIDAKTICALAFCGWL